jgi:hypothetical protein
MFATVEIPPKKQVGERKPRSVWLTDDAWNALQEIAKAKGYGTRSEMLTEILEQIAEKNRRK